MGGWILGPRPWKRLIKSKICANHELSLNAHLAPRSLASQGLNTSSEHIYFIIIFKYGIRINSGNRQ